MFTFSLIIHLFLCYFLPISASISTEMEKNDIVPDVIDVAPTETIEIIYPNNVRVEMGNKLTPRQVKDPPTTIKWPTIENTFYTLCLTDPDAPSRQNPKFREFHHWLIGNIPGNQIDKGDTLSEYISSAPPKGTGYHRYVFLIYKQPNGRIDFNETPRLRSNSRHGRPNFSIRKFAKKYNLGDPIAGNFYQAEWDDYVPVVANKLNGKK